MALLTWDNINFEIIKTTKKFFRVTHVHSEKILNDVSGYARSGSLVAIMGKSGCGKTTLLSTISRRSINKTGFVKLNNEFISDERLKEMSGFVLQQDIFPQYLTILELLEFQVNLSRQKVGNVRQILVDFNLDEKKFNIIRTLSHGEKRRLSLVLELITDPLLIFCDEPTTGLDSYCANIVAEKLQKMARMGKIVITTIHQPSSHLLQYLDEFILLDKGKLIFQGTKKETQEFFESYNLFCPLNYNVAEFYLKCFSELDTTHMSQIYKTWKKLPPIEDSTELQKRKLSSPNYFKEIKWLLWRSYMQKSRNLFQEFSLYFIASIEFLFIALFYQNILSDDQNTVQNIRGFLYFIGTDIIYTNMYASIGIFPQEFEIFLKEKMLYANWTYFLSKILILVPTCFVSSVIFMTVYFCLVGFLKGAFLWFKMTIFVFLVSIVSACLGLTFSALFSSVEYVELYFGTFEFVLLLMSGIMVNLETIPSLFSWLKYISPFFYCFEGLSNLFWNDFGGESLGLVYTNIFYMHFLVLLFCLIGFLGLVRKKNMYEI